MTYTVRYYKVPLFLGQGHLATKQVEAENVREAREVATKFWGSRNVKSIEWVR
mgnify:CR=1 FL=1